MRLHWCCVGAGVVLGGGRLEDAATCSTYRQQRGCKLQCVHLSSDVVLLDMVDNPVAMC